VHHQVLLQPIKSALNAAAGPESYSYVIAHGQQLLQLPAEDKTGLSGTQENGRRGAGHIEFDHIALIHSPAIYKFCGQYQSVERGLHEVPEEVEDSSLAAVPDHEEKVLAYEQRQRQRQQQQRQQQQQLGVADSAAAVVPLEVLVTTGGHAGSHDGVTTLFEVRLSTQLAAAAAACSSTAYSSTAAAAAARNTAGRVIAKALLSYRRAGASRDAPVPANEAPRSPLMDKAADPKPRMSPCIEWIEVQGEWRGKGIGRRLLQVRGEDH
jgi:GNAT superfamily N-acetyltransferase